MDNNKLVRFLLTFFLGFIGSIIINHSSLSPKALPPDRGLTSFFPI